MPTYEFRCPDGTIIERSFKISDAPQEIPAPDGSGMAVRVISGGAGLHFKGSGFYITDYGKDGKKDQRTKAEAAKAEAGKSDAGKAAAPSEGGATATTGSERAGVKGAASAADRPSEKQSDRQSEKQSEKRSEKSSEKPAAKAVESAPSKPATGGSSGGASGAA